MFLKGIEFCGSNRNTDIQANFFLNKRSRNVTELRGNLTFKIPLDDTLSVSLRIIMKLMGKNSVIMSIIMCIYL